MPATAGHHVERRAGGDPDALAGEADDRRRLVVDRHPDVEAVGARDVDAVPVQACDDGSAPPGVFQPGPVDVGDGVVVGQQADQDPLQQPAAPPLPELAP